MQRALVLGVILGCLAGSALAGAWPREKGRTFLSVSTVPARTSSADWSGVYAERGLTPRLTLGFDAGRGHAELGDWQALAFLRWDLAPEARLRRAVSLGLGARAAEGTITPLIRPAFALGRGFESRLGHGWMEAEAQILYEPLRRWTATKLDTTLGLERDRRLWMLQLQAARYPGSDPTLRLVPGVVQKLTHGLSLDLAVTVNLRDRSDTGLRLGAWWSF